MTLKRKAHSCVQCVLLPVLVLYWTLYTHTIHIHFHSASLLLPVYFTHHGLDIDRNIGSSDLGLLYLLLLPQDDGMDPQASILSILLQLGWTGVETETGRTQIIGKPRSVRRDSAVSGFSWYIAGSGIWTVQTCSVYSSWEEARCEV